MELDPGFSEHLAELALISRIWWALAGMSLAAMALVCLRGSARRRRAQLHPGERMTPLGLFRMLHRSQSATASLEYLLVLIPFLIIVMTVWQLALMFNAQLYVGYAAYAAARSAAVQIPTKYADEFENVLKNQKAGGAEKWTRIRRATIPGTLPISPGKFADAAGVWGVAKGKSFIQGGVQLENPKLDQAGPTFARLSLMTIHQGVLSQKRLERAAAKSVYADNATIVFVNGTDHRGRNVKGELKVESEQVLAGNDTVDVTVRYVFWLNVPFVGRMLEFLFEGVPVNEISEKAFNPYPTMVLSESVSMKLWRQLRATDPC